MSQRILRSILEPLCTVTMVPTIKAALSLLRSEKYDIIVTDFLFPSETAIPLIQLARSLASETTLPVVVVSGSMDSTMLSKVLQAGANEGIAKPLKVDEMRAVVSRMLADPYVRQLESRTTEVTCLQWQSHGVHYEFCPEIGIKVSGATRDEAHLQMSTRLMDEITHGARVGVIHNERLVTHMIKQTAVL